MYLKTTNNWLLSFLNILSLLDHLTVWSVGLRTLGVWNGGWQWRKIARTWSVPHVPCSGPWRQKVAGGVLHLPSVAVWSSAWLPSRGWAQDCSSWESKLSEAHWESPPFLLWAMDQEPAISNLRGKYFWGDSPQYLTMRHWSCPLLWYFLISGNDNLCSLQSTSLKVQGRSYGWSNRAQICTWYCPTTSSCSSSSSSSSSSPSRTRVCDHCRWTKILSSINRIRQAVITGELIEIIPNCETNQTKIVKWMSNLLN